ncbi:two-component system OmpR family response regulator/two-component system response regulator QseB [Palleronia aestuarii]|uniref:Two-component system OmpR family response regulator/two-component system response regulator QseB n=1 Tax=Palleronia aestuarii TaxID=568105 RepID=A0A2W7N1T5_9RHOB|nr:response regulator transcription factor [Palleronia aestuarii]PZX14365.1 two-component system OmpR family response regulator/two-component system response regulator QseB [Palleronia aestuarii]
MRIVIAEDNESLSGAITHVLKRAGYAVDQLFDGIEASEHLAGADADLLILDMNLPRRQGLEIMRDLRSRGQGMPVLILTARGGVADRVAGLDAGADDYMTKPFPMDELLARVRALLRRRTRIMPTVERLGAMEFDRGTGTLNLEGTPIDLAPRERALFELLFERAGTVVAKTHIADSLYGLGAEVETNAVELAVSRLRRKLGKAASIRTIRGLGYLLEPGT